MKRSLAPFAALLVAAIPGAAAGQSAWDAAALEAELRQALATVATTVGDITVIETDTGIEAAVAELGIPFLGSDVIFANVIISAAAVDAATIDFDLAFHAPGTPNRIMEPVETGLALTYDRASATGSWSVPMQAPSAFNLAMDRVVVEPTDPDELGVAISAATVVVSTRASISADGEWHLTETFRVADFHAGRSLLTLSTIDRVELSFEMAGDDWHHQRGSLRYHTWPRQSLDRVADTAVPRHIQAAVMAEGVLVPLGGTLRADKLRVGTVWDISTTATARFSMAVAGLSPGLASGYVPAPYLEMLPESGALDLTIEHIPADLARAMVLRSIARQSFRQFPSDGQWFAEALDRAGTTVRLDRFETVAPGGGVRAEGVATVDADALAGATMSSRVTLIGLDELIDRIVEAQHLSLGGWPLTDLRDDGVARAPERGLSVYEYLIEMAADGIVTVNGEVQP